MIPSLFKKLKIIELILRTILRKKNYYSLKDTKFQIRLLSELPVSAF